MPSDTAPRPVAPLTRRQSVQDAVVHDGLSRTPQGARQLISRTHDLTLRIARAQVAAGHREPVVMLIADLESLLTEEPVQPVALAVLAHAEADAADDVVLTQYLLDPRNPTLIQRARLALGRTSVAAERCLAALRRSA